MYELIRGPTFVEERRGKTTLYVESRLELGNDN